MRQALKIRAQSTSRAPFDSALIFHSKRNRCNNPDPKACTVGAEPVLGGIG